MNDVIRLEGTRDQVRMLEESIAFYRMVFMRLAGINSNIDRFVAETDQVLGYWQESIKLAKEKLAEQSNNAISLMKSI